MDAAERARIDAVKQAVLAGRSMPMHAKPLVSPIDWRFEAFLGLGQLGLFGVGFAVCRALGMSSPAGVYASAMAIMVLGITVSVPLRSRRTKQRHRAVMDILGPHRGRVCPVCHYALSSLPSPGQCPECGTLYTHRQIVNLWLRTYDLKTDWLASPERESEREGPES